jgi:hypothetical protein
MISSFKNSKNVDFNGTISRVPIKKIWYLFAGTVAMIILLIISSDFQDLWALLLKVIFFASTPVLLWVLLRTIYIGDHITMVATLRFYFKREHVNYEISPDIFKKGPSK